MTIHSISNHSTLSYDNDRSKKIKIPVRYSSKQNNLYRILTLGHKKTLDEIPEVDESLPEHELYSASVASVFVINKTMLTKSRTYHQLPPPPSEDDDEDDSLANCEKKIEQKMIELTNQLLQQQKKQDNHSAAADTSSRAFLEDLQEEISRLDALEKKTFFPMSQRRQARITKHKERMSHPSFTINDLSTPPPSFIEVSQKDLK